MRLLGFDSVILFFGDEGSETALDPVSVFIPSSRRGRSFVIRFASFRHTFRDRQFFSSVRIDFLALADAGDGAAFIHAIPGGAFPRRRFADRLPGRVSGVAGGQARLARTGAVGNDHVHRTGVHRVHRVHRVGVSGVCSFFFKAKHFRTSPHVTNAIAGVAIVVCHLRISISAC